MGVYKGCGENLVSFSRSLTFCVLRATRDRMSEVVYTVYVRISALQPYIQGAAAWRGVFFSFFTSRGPRGHARSRPFAMRRQERVPLLDQTTERRRGATRPRDPAPRISSTRKTPTAVPPRHRRLVLGLSPIAGHTPCGASARPPWLLHTRRLLSLTPGRNSSTDESCTLSHPPRNVTCTILSLPKKARR